ncbi:MAG TPA: DsbA family protein [Bacillaceae bacterium]
MNRKQFVIGTLLVFAAIVVLVLYMNKQDSAVQENGGNQSGKQPSIENQPTVGEEEAPVSIIEFGDYKCPSCKAWGERVYPELEKDFINNGQVKFSYINVLFHGKESVLASLASEWVFKNHPDAFWNFHNALFAAQPASQQHDERWVTPEALATYAQATVPGIDLEKFNADLKEQKTLDEVKRDDQLVKEANIQFTPSIMINGVLIEDPFDYEAIVSQIEKELEKQK